MDEKTRQRFWSKIDRRGPKDCWEWRAGRIWSGYGHFRIDGKKKVASRVMWELQNGPVPDGLKVLHECDNPPCCNPSHLFLGTQKENMMDCVRKRRTRFHSHPETARGSGHPAAKLNEWQVVGIMVRWLSGQSQKSIAAETAIGRTQVGRICRGETWKHLFAQEDANG